MALTGWYLAPNSNGRAFVPWNLMKFPQLTKYFGTPGVVVIGRQNGEISKSNSYVKARTNEGIYTVDGEFYPYMDAHTAYICFETAFFNNYPILYNWMIEKGSIKADVYQNEGFSKGKILESNELVSGASLKDVLLKSKEGVTFCISLYDRKDGTMKNSDSIRTITPQHQEQVEKDPEKVKSLLEELDSLIGITQVKHEIRTLTNILSVNEMRKERGLVVPKVSRHMAFTGPPGTGKTTVARLFGQITGALGILSKGHLIEVDRSGLVAGYLGQTALKVREVINEAMGGILLIDEAYNLVNGDRDEFGSEAVATLIKAMEDNRDDLIVILAGYTNEMGVFISSNPGFKSRINKFIEFPNYAASELVQIHESICTKNGFNISDEISELLMQKLESPPINFGNARGVRNLFERTIEAQANRLSQTEEVTDKILQELTINDLKNAIEIMGIL